MKIPAPRRPSVIVVPFHLGQARLGVGAGPEAIATGAGLETAHTVAAPTAQFEVARIFEIARVVAGRVADAKQHGDRVLVLAGECATALGTTAGAGSEDLGVIWLDSHADFNTPETSASGFLEGMALAMVTGRCWRTLCGSVPGWLPIAPERVILAGVRSVDACEAEALSSAGLICVGPSEHWAAGFESALDALAARVRRVYLHVDLDVLDADEAPTNAWASPMGLSTTQLAAAIDAVADRFTVEAAALTALDPAFDSDGLALTAAAQAADQILHLIR